MTYMYIFFQNPPNPRTLQFLEFPKVLLVISFRKKVQVSLKMFLYLRKYFCTHLMAGTAVFEKFNKLCNVDII